MATLALGGDTGGSLGAFWPASLAYFVSQVSVRDPVSENEEEARKMAQQAKVLPAKLDDLSYIS